MNIVKKHIEQVAYDHDRFLNSEEQLIMNIIDRDGEL